MKKHCISCKKELNGTSYKRTTVPSVSQFLITPYIKKATKTNREELDGIIIKEYCNMECYHNEYVFDDEIQP